jgi:hypothetical protein
MPLKYLMTKSDSLLICGSPNPGRTVGWFGGAGPLGGGGARMLDRAVELRGKRGAGREGLTCGLVSEYSCAELLPVVLDCLTPTACCKMGSTGRNTRIKINHQHHHIVQVICEGVTPIKATHTIPPNLKVWSKEAHTTQLEYKVPFTGQYGVHCKPQTDGLII